MTINYHEKHGSSFHATVIDRKSATDVCMAAVLICLIIGLITQHQIYFQIAVGLLILNMIWPIFFKPVAIVWIRLSIFLGTIISKMILTLIFFVLVTPVGVVRRLIGADSMQIKKWRNGCDSVFTRRDYRFDANDLEKPF